MKVKIHELLGATGASKTLTEEFPLRKITLQDRLIRFPQTPVITVTVTNTKDQILIRGYLEGEALLACSRCLEDFLYPFKFDFTETYEKKGPQAINLYNELDISEEIYQHTILNIPISVICHEGCNGICPRCGRNKNHEECQCIEPATDPRWEKLRRLLE